jgi:hypothetical protein
MNETGDHPYYPALFKELRRLGYVEGKNLIVARYSGEGREDTPPRAEHQKFRHGRPVAGFCYVIGPNERSPSAFVILANGRAMGRGEYRRISTMSEAIEALAKPWHLWTEN